MDRSTTGRPLSPVAPPFTLSDRAARTIDQPIGFLITAALANPNLISLAAGLVDFETLPTRETKQLIQELLSDDEVGRARLNYGPSLGLTALRQELIKHLAKLDGQTVEQFGIGPEQVVVSNGSQQVLALLTEVLVTPGDIVITAWPSYFVYSGVLVTAGAQVRCVDTDDNGMIPEQLEKVLREIEAAGQLDRVKIVYVVSYHDNPTSLTLSEDRRPKLLDIVKRFSKRQRILLMEDAAYRELTFEGQPPRSIRYYDPKLEHVALLQTFSKPFAPGFKVGYGILPMELVDKVGLIKDNFDFGTANLNQHTVLRAMTSGLYDRHVVMLQKRYHAKAKAMLEALQKHLGDYAKGDLHWTHPRGGLYVWLTLPSDYDTARDSPFFKKCVHEGVLYVPGAYCYGPDPTRKAPKNTLRLSFGTVALEKISEGIRRLATAIRSFR